MRDEETTLAALRATVQGFSRERAWTSSHTPKNLSMAIVAEASELMEHFLWDDETLGEPAHREEVRDELADVLIYVLEFASATGIDLAAAVAAKIAKNARRFPVEESQGRRTRRSP